MLMASQEDDERFEQEFLGVKPQTKQAADISEGETEQATMLRQSGVGVVVDGLDGNGWEDDQDQDEDDNSEEARPKDPSGLAPKAPAKKKYTQKRTTRLHRSTVLHSCCYSERNLRL